MIKNLKKKKEERFEELVVFTLVGEGYYGDFYPYPKSKMLLFSLIENWN